MRKYLEYGDGVPDVGEVCIDVDTCGKLKSLPPGGLVGMETGVWYPPCHIVSYRTVVLYRHVPFRGWHSCQDMACRKR